jgi:peptidoglycan/xylan/chitin deacetylase (PgdA/CDA1 family)
MPDEPQPRRRVPPLPGAGGSPTEEPDVVAQSDVPVRPGTRYVIGIRPKLLIVGQRDVKLRVKLARRGFNYDFSGKAGDSFRLHAQPAPGARRAEGEDLPVWDVTEDDGELVGTVPEVTPSMLGWHEIVLTVGGRDSEPVPFAVRAVEKVRVALTFDDGPSVEPFGFLGRNSRGEIRTPTEAVLDTLAEEGIAAAFFVLTSRDKFLFKGHPKAETPKGFALLRRTFRDGHVVAAHWGGDYQKQTRLHTSRIDLPAYDSDGDGEVDKVSEAGNALESDLIECVGTINRARRAEGISDRAPEWIRPPLWAFKDGDVDTRPTYDRFGLKMLFTDAKLYDGGYSFSGFTLDSWMCSDVAKGLDRGYRDIILTMHDSNPNTARDLPDVLRQVRVFMSKRGLEEKKHWEFVSDTAELEEMFRGKTRYVRLAKDS